MAKARDYKAEYKATHGTAKGKKDRASRNKARAEAMKAGKVRKGDGKEIDHKDFNPRNNSSSNLRVVAKAINRRKQPKRS
jgi:HNH endonuclease